MLDARYAGDTFFSITGFSELHCLTTQKTVLFIVTALRTSNQTK
jgi:heme/copper-type cytochrome/quinol oxidase subunit 3